MEVEWQEEKKRNVEGSLMRTTCRTTGLFKALIADCFWGWGEFPTLRKNLETWVEKKYKGWQNFSIKSWWWDHALLQETQSDNCGTVQTESTVWLHEHGYLKQREMWPSYCAYLLCNKALQSSSVGLHFFFISVKLQLRLSTHANFCSTHALSHVSERPKYLQYPPSFRT